MAKTAVKTLGEVSIVGDGDPTRTRQRIQEGAEWFAANADKRTRVDAKTSKRMLDEAVYARAHGVNARTFAFTGGMLLNKSGQPDKMGNPTGTVTLAYNAAGPLILAEKHDKPEIAETLRAAWNTLPDRKLSGKNGAIQAAKDALAKEGIGVRKAADRGKTIAGYSLAWVQKVLEKFRASESGQTVKINQRELPGFNAYTLARKIMDGETVSESDYSAVVVDKAKDSDSKATARPARSASSPRRARKSGAAAA